MTIRDLGCALAVAAATLIGCRPADEIRSYTVPKEPVVRTSPAPSAMASATGTDRMLAAILPDGDRAWFFKLTGPEAEVGARADEIEKFLTSVRLAPGKARPDWQLPSGWQEQPASAMRAATLLVPAGAKPLELSVTVLPWPGGTAALVSNVNRWRGQMQLAPTDEEGLAQSTRELSAGDAKLTLVDLTGHMTGGMTPPFAGGAMRAAPTPEVTSSPPSGEKSGLPPGHPNIAATSSPPETPFEFTTPAGWQQLPATGIRKAQFEIRQDGQAATVTAIDFPADSPAMMSDPLANANRWRGEVGLSPLDEAAAKDALHPLLVDGAKGIWVAAVPDATVPGQSESGRGTLAAMLTHGESLWFFKLTGNRDLVAAQRDKFQQFLKSLRFAAPGADHGN